MKIKANFRVVGLGLALARVAAGQPVITAQPQDQTNYVGTTATFAVVATGATPISYQWQKFSTGFGDLFGRTNALLQLCNVQTNDAGDYRVRMADNTGTTNSATAHLYVAMPERLFISQPAPGLVTLNWQGSMVLLELWLGTPELPQLWFRVSDSSPVTLPVKSGAQFFKLLAAHDIAATFQRDLRRCDLLEVKGCEDCVQDYFLMGTPPYPPSSECESAAVRGIELGSTVLLPELEILMGLQDGVQPIP